MHADVWSSPVLARRALMAGMAGMAGMATPGRVSQKKISGVCHVR